MGGADGGPGTGNYWWWPVWGAGSIDGDDEGVVFLNSVDWAGIPVLHVRRYCVPAATLARWMSPRVAFTVENC